ncbi:hypothetical protein Tsubulata_004837 [Turnera subulata]|uniref:RING-type domain-containing protein n=1 Tax=Turnera subulata TaxID=218843 RepID=A0A9Q0JR09_9ROSI|nr:hypothetical protein Tsubulata_004837 [Turnera subulata]
MDGADKMPCSSGAELFSREKSTHVVDTDELRSLPHGMDVADSSPKVANAQSSLAHHNYNLGRSLLLKRSRHYYGHQYSRRNFGSHGNASTSLGRAVPLQGERITFKLATGSEYGNLMENRDRAFGRPERIRFSSSVMDAVSSSEAVKMVCGICQKLLRRKPYFLGETLSAGEFSVVAVLVCGHIFHADCLEQRTSLEDIRDPPCPLCLELLSQANASKAYE